jgi:hypothetical protein
MNSLPPIIHIYTGIYADDFSPTEYTYSDDFKRNYPKCQPTWLEEIGGWRVLKREAEALFRFDLE